MLLVANPMASRFTGARYRDVTEILSVAFDVATVWPNGPQEAWEIASAAAAEGVDVVAAMGGDGIAHRIANAVAGTDAALAVIPAGTTNVLARVIGLTANPRRAAERIVAGTTSELPALRVVTHPGETDDIALFSVGVGLDADIVALAEKEPIRKVGLGPVHYARSALSVMVREYARAHPTLRVAAPARRADAVGLFVQVHDRYTDVARLPMRLTPTRSAGLTALVIHRVTAPIAARVVARGLTRRDLNRVPGVEVWQGIAHLTVDADPPARCQADGELLGTADRIEISPSDRRLLVITSP